VCAALQHPRHKNFGSSHKSVQNFVFKIPQKMLNQLNLKDFNKIPRVDKLLSFPGSGTQILDLSAG
jgi:hypothetical protein